MLTFFVIVILVALALQRLSLRNAGDHRNIRYECKPSVRACEPGDVFLVHSNVANLGLRPSPSIRIEERFPQSLNVLEAEQFNVRTFVSGYRIFYSTVLLGGHQQIRRSLRASIPQRGEYRFSYADFCAGDFLGCREYNYRMDNDSRRAYIAAEGTDPTYGARPLRRAIQRLLEDPISVCGYRDYTGREPMRQISWKQSAARGSLIVKQFDPVWQHSVLIALDTQLHGDFDEYIAQQEYCFSLARTVCEQLEQRGVGYQLVTNAVIREGLSGFSSSGGMGGAFRKILYALGGARLGSVASVDELMHAVCHGAERCEMIVLISTHGEKRVESALGMARGTGCGRIVTLFADELMPVSFSQPEEKEATA